LFPHKLFLVLHGNGRQEGELQGRDEQRRRWHGSTSQREEVYNEVEKTEKDERERDRERERERERERREREAK